MDLWIERRESKSKAQSEDERSEFDRDYARVIHSASFRSLQGKPQILNLGDSDYYRTRLTHSLEVVQLSVSILRQLSDKSKFSQHDLPLPDQTMLQAICHVHDLGHPPFGHGGEVALNYCMRDNGGFEGNGQTLRILSKLEAFSDSNGSNLTRRTLLGTLKYPIPYSKAVGYSPTLQDTSSKDGNSILRFIDREKSKPPKCYMDSENDAVEWLLSSFNSSDKATFLHFTPPTSTKHGESKYKSFDCSIMDTCDDIAFGVHDLEDAIILGLISKQQFLDGFDEADMKEFLDSQKAKYKAEYTNDVYQQFLERLFSAKECKHQINRMVHYFNTNIEIIGQPFSDPVLKYKVQLKAESKKFIKALKGFVWKNVIKHPSVQHLEFKGQRAVVSVFEVFASEPEFFLPPAVYKLYQADGKSLRRICDYIASMTDASLLKTYDRLFSPRMGSVFDRL